MMKNADKSEKYNANPVLCIPYPQKQRDFLSAFLACRKWVDTVPTKAADSGERRFGFRLVARLALLPIAEGRENFHTRPQFAPSATQKGGPFHCDRSHSAGPIERLTDPLMQRAISYFSFKTVEQNCEIYLSVLS